MKNIFESGMFWSRINSFFDIRINFSDLQKLAEFYNIEKVDLDLLYSEINLKKGEFSKKAYNILSNNDEFL